MVIGEGGWVVAVRASNKTRVLLQLHLPVDRKDHVLVPVGQHRLDLLGRHRRHGWVFGRSLLVLGHTTQLVGVVQQVQLGVDERCTIPERARIGVGKRNNARIELRL